MNCFKCQTSPVLRPHRECWEGELLAGDASLHEELCRVIDNYGEAQKRKPGKGDPMSADWTCLACALRSTSFY
jgi:hypothetical protein